MGGSSFSYASRFAVALVLLLLFPSCGIVSRPDAPAERLLKRTIGLAAEVKEFGTTLGIEPTQALTQFSATQAPLSMLWFWMQRVGTLALRAPIDIRMAVGFSAAREQLKLEQVYRVDGYSVYYRQGNEFADPRSAATVSFAEEGLLRRVKVILHEDLHGDKNFDLPWEIEESIVTPLGSLAAVEFFKQKGDKANTELALASIAEERLVARELNRLAAEAEKFFKTEPAEQAKKSIVARLSAYPNYHRQFQRQVEGQNSGTVLEAKLSHDLAYFRFFDAIAALAEKVPNLRTLIEELQRLPADASVDRLEKHIEYLHKKYHAPAIF